MKAPCSYYRKCSGCTLLQFPYAKQLHDKDLAVRQAFAAFAGNRTDSPVFAPIVRSPLELGYRASTKLCLNEDTFGRRAIGLYERGSKTVVGIPECPVHHPSINRLIKKLFSDDAPLPAPFYNHAKRAFQPGRLKFLTVRVAPDGDMAGIVLSHTGVEREALVAWAKRFDGRRLAIYESPLTKQDDDRILSESATHLAGAERLSYQVAGHEFHLSPLAFFQANFALTEAFVAHVTEGLEGSALLDLYGGFGAYAFAAAAHFDRVWLVDGNASAIAAAAASNVNPTLPGLTPVHASIEDFLARQLKRSGADAATHAIVNPPRAGLSPKVKAGLGRDFLPRLEKLVYVSCNPQTLARDLAELTRQHGFKVRNIQSFDMFPQTDHVELVVRLVR